MKSRSDPGFFFKLVKKEVSLKVNYRNLFNRLRKMITFFYGRLKGHSLEIQLYKLFLGFEYPNSTIFGALFLGIGLVGLGGLMFHIFELKWTDLIVGFISLAFLSLGILSVGSYKIVELNFNSNTITVGTRYCFIFFNNETFDLSTIDKMKVVHSSGGYTVGGGFLASARNSFSKKETNLFFYRAGNTKSIFKLADISHKQIHPLVKILSTRTKMKINNA